MSVRISVSVNIRTSVSISVRISVSISVSVRAGEVLDLFHVAQLKFCDGTLPKFS